jgi:hypothetical protein
MKKCIVLSGEYRTFDKTWQNIQKFIELNDLDVYCHVWADKNSTENKRQFHAIRDRLKPKQMLQEPMEPYCDIFDGIDQHIRFNNPKGPNQDRLAGNASMHYSRKKAFDLIKEEYDVLVYCRYDIAITPFEFHANIPVLLSPTEQAYNIISDIFAIMPFEFAPDYFLYDNYEQLHSTPFEPEFENWLRDVKNYGEKISEYIKKIDIVLI